MNIPSIFRLAAAVLLLAAPALAWDPSTPRDGDRTRDGNRGGPPQPVPANQIVPRAEEQFRRLRRRVSEKYEDKPELVRYVDVTKDQFVKEAKTALKKETYDPREIWYLGRVVEDVLIPAVDGLVEIASVERPEQERRQMQTALAMTVQSNYNTMAQSLPSNLAQEGEPAPNLSLPIGFSGAVTNTVQNGINRVNGWIPGSTGNPNGPNRDGSNPNGPNPNGDNHRRDVTPEELKKFLDESEVLQIALRAANYAIDPANAPKPEPVPPVTTNPPVVVKPELPKPTEPEPLPEPKPTPPLPPGGVLHPVGVGNNIVYNPGDHMIAERGGSDLLAGDYEKALKSARRALAINPRNQSALSVLHTVQGRAGGQLAKEAGEAAATAKAAALGGGFAGADSLGGPAAPSAEIAAAALSGAARVSGDQARAASMGAWKMGDRKAAIDILSKELAANPRNPMLLNQRAAMYAKLGQYDKAIADANAALALAPGNMVLLRTKALAENRGKKYEDALATADEMIKKDPNNAWGWAFRAHAKAGLGDRASMLADLRRAAELDPAFAKTAEAAALIQLPSDADVLFLFPGEEPAKAVDAPAAASGRGRGFGVVVVAGVAGGLLLALGLLSVVMGRKTAPSAFSQADRSAPASAPSSAPRVPTAQPASAGGLAGGLIRGQYSIARQIGQGGMGMVFEGTDKSLGRRVAIKKMRDELRLNARERDRFIIEAKTVASLHHPNIVDIYAIAEEGDDVYLVFEYVDGKTVHDAIQAAGRLDPREAVRVAKSIGEALTFAHGRGVIHRDMKPSNVMLSGRQVKVMDFGIARMAKDALTRYSMTNTVVGTPPYMAPEQEQGHVRKESDVYALAVCSYEMLTGKLPFIGIGAGMLMNKINMSYVAPSRAIAGLPEALDEVFAKAFQADPDRRYRTPSEFVAAFETAAGGTRSAA